MTSRRVHRSKARGRPSAARGGSAGAVPGQRVLLSALLGAAFASTVHAQGAVPDEAGAVPPAIEVSAQALVPSADVSDWGTHAAAPTPAPTDEDHREPRATLTVAEAKRDELEIANLVLVDDPPTGPGDDPPDPPAKGGATVRFAAGAQATPTPAADADVALMRQLAAVLGADLDASGHDAPRTADSNVATQLPASAGTVLATLAEVLGDTSTVAAHDSGLFARGPAWAGASGPEPEPAPPQAAPTPATKVLDTLARVLAGAHRPASAVPTDDTVDIPIEPTLGASVDLEIEIGAPTPVDIETEPFVVQPVDIELPLHAAADAAPQAAPPAPARVNPFGDDARVAVSDAGLDRARGGFTTPEGLRISFGIERAVYINGSLVTTTSLNVSDLGVISAGGAAPSLPALGSIGVIQNGAGNTFVPGAVPAGTLGTVIQNSLDDQKIQSVSVINASVNSLGMLRSMTMQTNLRNAIVDSLRR